MELLELFQGVYHIDNPAVLRRLHDTVQVCRLKKGEVYLHEGERQSRVMLLWSGIVRGYYTDVNGSEHTDCFCARRGAPAMPPCGLYDPSPINLMTLTDCEFAVLPVDDAVNFIHESPDILHLYSNLLVASMQLHNRIKNTLCNYSAKQKYDWFLQEYPGLIFDVNNRYIASFLNMTPETLSRLRAADRKAGPTAGASGGEKA